jgi:transcriptional regulator with XRE-family HTH domain
MQAGRSKQRSTEAAAAELLRRFGANLRNARIAAGMSQSGLALAASTSQPRVSRAEQGRVNLTVAAMVELATAVHADVMGLLAPTGNPRTKTRRGSGNLLLRNMP